MDSNGELDAAIHRDIEECREALLGARHAAPSALGGVRYHHPGNTPGDPATAETDRS